MNPKKECPRCKKTKRTKCFVYNKVLDESICKMCDKQVGTNKFYNPKSFHKNSYITNFSINTDEDKYLRKNGCNTTKLRENLKKMKKVSYAKRKQKTNQLKESKKQSQEKNKKFLEGLK